MRVPRRVLAFVIVTGLLASPAAQSLEHDLQRAMQRETTTGDLRAAIAEYRRIVQQAGPNRTVAATATLRMARNHERLGSPDARRLYEAIVRDFADQPAVVASARARLSATGPRQVEVTPRRVLEAGWSQMFDMSADGRFVVGPQRATYSGFSVVLRDVATGQSTTLVDALKGPGGYHARLSDDGRWVAFNSEGSLRTVATAGGHVETVVTVPSSQRVAPADWSIDGKSILAVLTEYGNAARPQEPTARKLAWVSVDTKTIRPIRTFEPWHQLVFDARVSPDGRFIAYSARPRADATDRYLYVMDAADGQNLRAVVTAAGSRELPVWTPDGAHLVFRGTSGETTALWTLAIRDGQAVGAPRIVQPMFRADALGFTSTGTFYYASWSLGGGNQMYVVNRPMNSDDRPAVFPGLNGGWSRVGRLAFLRDGKLILRIEATGEEQSWAHESLGDVSPRWLSDDSVLVLVDERVAGQTKRVFHRVDTRTGTFTRLFDRDAHGRLRTDSGAVSPDGRNLYLGERANEASPVNGIVAVDLATGEERPVLTFPQPTLPASRFGLTISPDGTTLAAQAWIKEYAVARIFTVGVDGSNHREVVQSYETGWIDDVLRWAPDGRTLLFVAFDANRNWRIMRVAADGGQPEFDGLSFDTLSKVLPDLRLFPGNFNNIDLSPEGSRILASTFTMGKYELWTLDNLLWTINAR
jgi:Tol biopolymer transport system component